MKIVQPGCPETSTSAKNFPGLSCSSPGHQCPYEEECCCGECAPLTLTCTTTTSGASQWQASSPCKNPTCGIGCQEGLGRDYTGTASTTIRGFECKPWSMLDYDERQMGQDQDTDQDHNYCRNMDDRMDGVWCHTWDQDMPWDYCALPYCGSGK